MTTVCGIALDRLGIASKRDVVQGSARPELVRQRWSTPPSQLRHVQADRIPINVEHDPRWVVGEVVAMEVDEDERLWVVGHIDDDLQLPANTYWSVESRDRDGRDVRIEGLALTTSPAMLGLQPLTVLPGALDHRSAADRWRGQTSPVVHELLTRAAQVRVGRHSGPIVVRDRTAHYDDLAPPLTSYDAARIERSRPTGALRHSMPMRGSVLRVR